MCTGTYGSAKCVYSISNILFPACSLVFERLALRKVPVKLPVPMHSSYHPVPSAIVQ